MANKKINVAELDFDAIKANLKEFLKGQSEFADYDFEGAGLSILLDLLAYNTHYNALYTNLAVNESFLDSASKRSSVVSRAKEIGYVPYSAKSPVSTIKIVVSATANTNPTLTIPAKSSFATTVDNQSYTFYNLDALIATRSLTDGTYTFNDVNITEGTPLSFKYTVTDGTRFIIPNTNVDTTTIKVYVQENATSATSVFYENRENLLNVGATTRTYWIKEIDGQLYELEFGNGVIGKALSNGNVVTIEYLTTNKDAANDARSFTYTGSSLDGGIVTIVPITPAYGGQEPEPIESIRYNAPRSYSAQNRAVTVEDYKSLVYSAFAEAKSINVWGGEDNVPKQYGKVFIAIQPTTTELLTTSQKDFIKTQILKSKNIVSITPEIVDPEYINIELSASVYYNPRLTTRTSAELKSLVVQTIKDYNVNVLNSFDGVFRFSNVTSEIDGTEDSIVSNITTLRLYKPINVKYNILSNYTIDIGNPISSSGVPEEALTSTGFYVSGNTNIMYLEDVPTDKAFGQVRMYYFENNVKTYYKTFGSVDYANGIINLTDLNITSIIQSSDFNGLQLIIKPQSNDVVSIRNQLVTINEDLINVNMIIDATSIGDPGAGKNYIFTSSRN